MTHTHTKFPRIFTEIDGSDESESYQIFVLRRVYYSNTCPTREALK